METNIAKLLLDILQNISRIEEFTKDLNTITELLKK